VGTPSVSTPSPVRLIRPGARKMPPLKPYPAQLENPRVPFFGKSTERSNLLQKNVIRKLKKFHIYLNLFQTWLVV